MASPLLYTDVTNTALSWCSARAQHIHIIRPWTCLAQNSGAHFRITSAVSVNEEWGSCFHNALLSQMHNKHAWRCPDLPAWVYVGENPLRKSLGNCGREWEKLPLKIKHHGFTSFISRKVCTFWASNPQHGTVTKLVVKKNKNNWPVTFAFFWEARIYV